MRFFNHGFAGACSYCFQNQNLEFQVEAWHSIFQLCILWFFFSLVATVNLFLLQDNDVDLLFYEL